MWGIASRSDCKLLVWFALGLIRSFGGAGTLGKREIIVKKVDMDRRGVVE